MPKRIFDTKLLIEWGIHDWYECDHVVHFDEIGMEKFEVECELVFRAPDDGRLWKIEIEINNGAGYNSITGISDSMGREPEPEESSFEATEVEERPKVVIEYVDVEERPPVTPQQVRDLLGTIMSQPGPEIMDVDDSHVPAVETLAKLSDVERWAVILWASDCHAEASDNDVRPGPCPEALRTMLPDDHPYKTWRVG